MEYFVFGIGVGYFLYPISETIGKIIRNAWNTASGCTGNCNQGRDTCNCGRYQ
jgi:hypothetical protein